MRFQISDLIIDENIIAKVSWCNVNCEYSHSVRATCQIINVMHIISGIWFVTNLSVFVILCVCLNICIQLLDSYLVCVFLLLVERIPLPALCLWKAVKNSYCLYLLRVRNGSPARAKDCLLPVFCLSFWPSPSKEHNTCLLRHGN